MPKQLALLSVTVVLVILALLAPAEALAQCPMCKANVESSFADPANAVGKGLNSGILYLLAMPYLFVLAIGVWWYRNQRRARIQMPLPS